MLILSSTEYIYLSRLHYTATVEFHMVHWFTRIIDMLIYDNQMFSTVTNRRRLIHFGMASWKAKVVQLNYQGNGKQRTSVMKRR